MVDIYHRTNEQTLFLVAMNGILGELGTLFDDDLDIYSTTKKQRVVARALKKELPTG